VGRCRVVVMLTGDQILAESLDDWRLLLRALHARFETGDFARALVFVDRIGAAAEAANHHPDLDLSWGRVGIKLFSHDVGGVTDRDVRLAGEISAIAAELGVVATPAKVSTIELALDTADHSRIKGFWQALLGYAANPALDDEVRDADGRLPTLWFQGTEPHEVPRQRFHLDVHVPHDQAEARIQAALAAGGLLVSDAEAPSFWVLADPDGNRACICTWQGRAATP
jgi:4a-hydroxytetrahydrobiopterin dehydratase